MRPPSRARPSLRRARQVGNNARSEGQNVMVPKDADSGWNSEGHWDWNVESNRIHFSPRWAALVGDDERELATSPESWFTKVHPDDLDRVSAALTSLLEKGGPDRFDLPHRIPHRDAPHRWMSCRGS